MIRCVFIISLSCSVLTIKVPLTPVEDSTEEASTKIEDTLKKKPIYYESDESKVDSYLIPPNPHNHDHHDEAPDAIATPSTYLLPPLPNSKSEYYIPTEPALQTDWYPIVQALPKTNDKVFINQPKTLEMSVPIYISDRIQNPKQLKIKKVDDSTILNVRVPSRQLLPPKLDFYIPPAVELQLPAINTNQQFAAPAPFTELQLPKLEKTQEFKPQNKIIPLRFNIAEPTLALDLVPPPVVPIKYKNPTKLYPKKYSNDFKPIPIPISQFAEDDNLEVPVAKPLQSFKPSSSSEEDYTLDDDKKIYLYEQAELKRQNNAQDEPKQQQEIETSVLQKSYADEAPEQDVSETGYRHAQPLREASQKEEATPPPPKDRTEFRMHGMKGPHSYQFGYDTGKGKNRQFRYEERDNDGHVKGHYGYVDRSGKLRVVNYDAHPEHGFHADAPQ